MRLKDLSTAALNQALTADAANPAGSLVYLFRFVDGYQSAGVSARWSPATGWSYAFTGYQVQSAGCASSGEECTTYTKEQDVVGSVDVAEGPITVSVPLSYLTPLKGTDAASRPLEVPAEVGSRIYDGTAITMRNPSPDPDTQSFMEPVDGAPAFDFRITGALPPPVVPESPVTALLPLLAVGVAGVLLVGLRRRRESLG